MKIRTIISILIKPLRLIRPGFMRPVKFYQNKPERFCGNCSFLIPKEADQSDKKNPHMCILYNKPVFHNGHHPKIPMPKFCYKNMRGIYTMINAKKEKC